MRGNTCTPMVLYNALSFSSISLTSCEWEAASICFCSRSTCDRIFGVLSLDGAEQCPVVIGCFAQTPANFRPRFAIGLSDVGGKCVLEHGGLSHAPKGSFLPSRMVSCSERPRGENSVRRS